ncbi:uracil-DNA glycosylase family protein [Robiginitalea sp. M366]|uniref:uracil-DNA glycosylase family protein n=1 Tax=Robiginitalea aestuariiviva TaxID=3036903 RepID=UPI00240D6BBD|nr:uracil-DNA glycosylase family protein [Robiginitalea aestuariiviva]MDG1573317.1 uracil-DNA glycosylase family protein [Robiginitalea aestuariiviva]
MTEEKFFYSLLRETDTIFKQSPIYSFQKERGFNWNYAICETPIQKYKALLFGLNWGGDDIDTQSEYPRSDKANRNWNFMSTSRKYFTKYLNIENENELNYSNLCFFRTPTTKPLTDKDWSLSLPLFEKYVDYIKPRVAILMGTTGVNVLMRHEALVNLERFEKSTNGRRSFAYRGRLFNRYKFYCVPHPQSRINSKVREQLWSDITDHKV